MVVLTLGVIPVLLLTSPTYLTSGEKDVEGGRRLKVIRLAVVVSRRKQRVSG